MKMEWKLSARHMYSFSRVGCTAAFLRNQWFRRTAPHWSSITPQGQSLRAGERSKSNKMDAVPPHSTDDELLAGGVAGALAKTSVAPLERTKILMQTGRTQSKGITGTLKFLWETEGVPGLFRGNVASVLRIVPYAAIHFSAYEWYRRLLVQHALPAWSGVPVAVPHPGDSTGPLPSGRLEASELPPSGASAATVAVAGLRERRKDVVVHPVWDLLAGSMAGATAVMITYPLDLVRTRMAYATGLYPAAAARSPSSSLALLPAVTRSPTIRGELVKTFREGGVVGLYRGMSPTLLGILPYAGLKFYFYQSFKASYRAQQLLDAASASSSGGEATARDVKKLPVQWMLLFGGLSGLAAQTVTYPLDVVRRRMQVHNPSSSASALGRPAGVTGAAGAGPSGSAVPSGSLPLSDRGGMPAASPARGAVAAGGKLPSWAGALSFTGNINGVGQGAAGGPGTAQPAPPSGQPQPPFATQAGSCTATAQKLSPFLPARTQPALARQAAVGLPSLAGGLPSPAAALSGPTAASSPHVLAAQQLRPPSLRTLMVGLASEAAAGQRTGGGPQLRPTTWSTLQGIVREEGVRGLFRGVSLNYIKAMPSTAIGFTVYDLLKSYLGVQGGPL